MVLTCKTEYDVEGGELNELTASSKINRICEVVKLSEALSICQFLFSGRHMVQLCNINLAV